MSVESLAIVLHHSKASGRDKLILIGIANHDGDGGAWPSKATLAKYANCGSTSVERSIRSLIELGEVARFVNEGGTRSTAHYERPNRYIIKVQCPHGCDRTSHHRVTVDNTKPLPLTNTGGGPSVGDTPSPTTGGTPPPVVGDLTILEPPLNSDQSPFVSTSPENKKVCWACGQRECTKGSYCTKCSSRGLNNPMIDCTGGCGTARKRHFPGQQRYACEDCKRTKAAVDDRGAES